MALGDIRKWVAAIGAAGALLATAWVIHRFRRTPQSYDRALLVEAEVTPAEGRDIEGKPTPVTLARVTNNGRRPISDVRMTLTRQSDGEVLAIHRFEEDIPAESSDSFELSADSELLGPPPPLVLVDWSISFRDVRGRGWRRSSDRSLRRWGD